MVNYLSLDFESWAYPNIPEFKTLDVQKRKLLDAGYVKESAEKILPLLKKYKTKLTFFVLGQLYDWYPQIIERIANDGHEIAYHTHTHDILDSEKTLVDSLERSRKFLEKFRPKGFRAPNMFIKKEHFPILRDYGFQYDSSIYYTHSLRYVNDDMLELPVSALYHLPVGSGYFIAIFGRTIGSFYRQINRNGNPVIAFLHNWQICKPQNATFPNNKYLVKHPCYLPYTFEVMDVFEYLLQKFSFAPMINLAEKVGKI